MKLLYQLELNQGSNNNVISLPDNVNSGFYLIDAKNNRNETLFIEKIIVAK